MKLANFSILILLASLPCIYSIFRRSISQSITEKTCWGISTLCEEEMFFLDNLEELNKRRELLLSETIQEHHISRAIYYKLNNFRFCQNNDADLLSFDKLLKFFPNLVSQDGATIKEVFYEDIGNYFF